MKLWYEKNWGIASKYCYHREGEPERWGRLVCPWVERLVSANKTEDLAFNYYAPLIDLHTGKVYLEMDQKAVLIRFRAQLLIRPLFTICLKTAYHLFLPLSIPCEIYEGVKEGRRVHWTVGRTIKHCSLRVIRSLSDAVRTPLYGTVLILHSLASIAIASIDSNRSIYNMMTASGKIERSLFWGEFHAEGTIYNCFQPDISFEELEDKWKNTSNSKDTFYRSKRSLNWALANYARKFIRKERLNPPIRCFKHYKVIDPVLKERVSNFITELRPLTPPDPSYAISRKAEKRAAQWRSYYRENKS